jgi:putative SOS response-associated peptidase YedK
LETCTVIVTDANGLLRELHDRMPGILPREDYEAWLDPANKDTTGLWKMLRPADPAPGALRQVSRNVNGPANDSLDLLDPVAAT